ncbi:MAG: CotH kinase family protein [Bacteroidota bacterium]
MKQLTVLLLMTMFSALQSFAQPFLYDPAVVQDIRITFTQPNWDYQMDTAAVGAEGFIIAQLVTINGVSYDSVGVKYKGNSSFNANNVKNPLHIELNYIKGNADYQGYTDLKLSNGFKDPSFVREPLSYEILRQYMHAPLANHAEVRINGVLYGLYMNAENIDKRFVMEHFKSDRYAFFKCNPIGGAGPGTGGSPDLTYLGTDSTLYYNRYEIKSDFGWADLIDFTNVLNNNPSVVIDKLDVDRALWMLAFNNVLVNLDSYTGGFSQNYYLYRDDNLRFNPISWDLNESFGCFTNSGAGNLTLTQEQQMSPLLHETNFQKPMISRLLGNPEYKRRYLAHTRTIINENFANNSYVNKAQTLQAIINSFVQADPNKFYTYSQFQNSITTGIPGGMGTIPGLSQLMGPRTTWLLQQTQFTAVPPAITNIQVSNASPSYLSQVTVTSQVANCNLVRMGYRDATWKKFNYLQMYDDGQHGDGAANDNVYGATFQVTSARMQYYIYAENANAGIFSPERAEHEFYSLNASLPVAASGQVALNEILAINVVDTVNQYGEHSDWVELYNNTSSTLNMNGLYLSDNATNLGKWAFPEGTLIGPYGFLLVFCDERTSSATELHANFKLSGSAGEVVYLTDSINTYDFKQFGSQFANISLHRCPNGTGPWALITNTTPNYANYCPTGIAENEIRQSFRYYPNPTQNMLHWDSEAAAETIEICDITGRVMMILRSETDFFHGDIDVTMLAAGTYVFKANHQPIGTFIRN